MKWKIIKNMIDYNFLYIITYSLNIIYKNRKIEKQKNRKIENMLKYIKIEFIIYLY